MGVPRATIPPELAAAPSALFALRRLWSSQRPAAAWAVVAVAAVTAYAFWPTLAQLANEWFHNPQYSHGVLVPAFSAALLWKRRDRFPARAVPAPVAGLALMAFAAAVRLYGAAEYSPWPEQVSLLPWLLGLVLAFGGWPVLRWSAPAVLFLFFMIPMPYTITIWLGFPLQQLATTCSTYVLQTLGQPAIAEGNTILIRDFQLSIVKACSGLSMLVTFFTFSTAVCLLVTKPFSDKLLILLSAIPIALAANIIRIVVTGLMFLHVSNQAASAVFHDLAGWVMMPLALAFLGAELWVLKRLFVDPPTRPSFR
ncbi:MAG TPA: exosortase/archaeosortase family protein [Gemmataceae bacterium]|jgi:exosortase